MCSTLAAVSLLAAQVAKTCAEARDGVAARFAALAGALPVDQAARLQPALAVRLPVVVVHTYALVLYINWALCAGHVCAFTPWKAQCSWLYSATHTLMPAPVPPS